MFAGVLDDLKALPTRELRILAMTLLLEIEAGRVTGKPLDARAHTGDLSDCFKLYFDHPQGDRPAFRIVYRLNPDSSPDAARIQAVAVGKRQSLAVYQQAVNRIQGQS